MRTLLWMTIGLTGTALLAYLLKQRTCSGASPGDLNLIEQDFHVSE